MPPKNLLKFVLCFQLLASPLGFAHATASPEPPPPKSVPANSGDPETADLRDLADQLETGKFEVDPKQITDLWGTRGQFVRVFNDKGEVAYQYDLDKPSLEREKLAFTNLRPEFDEEEGCLAIVGTRGENAKGENGKLVAKMYLPEVRDVAKLIHDNEILSMVDSSARLRTIDMGYVSNQAFRSLIQIHNNWTPLTPIDLRGKTVELSYLTIGRRPVDPERLIPGGVLPHDEQGELKFSSGSLLVTADGQPVGIFDRGEVYLRFMADQAALFKQASIVNRTSEQTEQIATLFKDAEVQTSALEDELARVDDSTIDKVTALSLSAIGTSQLKALFGRIQDQKAALKRPRDWYYLAEWQNEFSKIEAKARAQNPELTEDAIAANWRSFLEKSNYEKQKAEGRTPLSNPKLIAGLLLSVAPIMLLPKFYEDHQALQQYEVFSRAYAMLPAVLKDASYRWPLIASTVSLMSLWPITMMASVGAGKALEGLRKASEKSSSKFAHTVNDMTKAWAPLDTWQRISAVCVRIFAETVVAPWIHVTKGAFKQKNLIAAATLNLNIFKKITADSPTGQKVGLTRDTYLGFVNPLAADREERLNKQRELIAEVYSQKMEIKKYHWLLAAIAVAEEHGIDVATLKELSDLPNPKLSDLRKLIYDDKAREHWEITARRLSRQITSLPLAFANGQILKVEPDLLARNYADAKEVAAKVYKLKGAKLWLQKLRTKVARQSVIQRNAFLNWGSGQAEFLKTVFPNKSVTDQVEREIVIDHLIVVILVALFGRRADLSHPENLAAMRGHPLFVNPPHMADVANNANLGIGVGASMQMLQFQSVHSKVQDGYEPRETYTYHEPVRPGPLSHSMQKLRSSLGFEQPAAEPKATQAFVPGLLGFARDALMPWKTDFGGLAVLKMTASAQIFFSSFWIGLGVRTLLGNQNLPLAAMASLLAIPTGYWFYGWVWSLVQGGNRYYAGRFKEKYAEFMSARLDLQWGLREGNPTQAIPLLERGIARMKAIYGDLPLTESFDEDSDMHLLAERYILLSDAETPGPLHANLYVPMFTTGLGSIFTTYLAIPWMIMTYNPANLTFTNLAEWTLISGALFGAAKLLLSKYSFDNLPILRKAEPATNAISKWTREKTRTTTNWVRECRESLRATVPRGSTN